MTRPEGDPKGRGMNYAQAVAALGKTGTFYPHGARPVIGATLIGVSMDPAIIIDVNGHRIVYGLDRCEFEVPSEPHLNDGPFT
jgi:hypothetical protein